LIFEAPTRQPSPFLAFPPQSPLLQTQPKHVLSPIGRREVVAFAKAKKKSQAKAHKNPKLYEILEKNETLELKEGVLAYVKAMPAEERKLAGDARLTTLASKTSREVPEEVVLESLKTFSSEEV